MADPQRRTLLAKLRGKKSKKGTTVGEFGVATFGNNREGKDGVSLMADEQTRILSDRMMVKENYLRLESENRVIGSPRGKTVVNTVSVKDNSCVHVNTKMSAVYCKNLGVTGRFNEDIVGGFCADEMQTRVRYSNETNCFKELELGTSKEVSTEPFRTGQGFEQLKENPASGTLQKLEICQNKDVNRVRFFSEMTPVIRTDQCTGMCGRGEKDEENRKCGEYAYKQYVQDRLYTDDRKNVVLSHPSQKNSNLVRKTDISPFIISLDCPQENMLSESKCVSYYRISSRISNDHPARTLQNTGHFPTGLVICDEDLERQTAYVRDAQLDSSFSNEEGDYYDNENLPFYDSKANSNKMDHGAYSNNVEVNSAQSETEEFTPYAKESKRVRTQFKEACFLLISAMQDISFDNQGTVNGFKDQVRLSRCHSQDSIRTDVFDRAGNCEAFSPQSHIVQHVSVTDWLPFGNSKIGNQHPKVSVISKSFENLPVNKPLSLRRCVSDGAINYCQGRPWCFDGNGPQMCVSKHSWRTACHVAGQDDLKNRRLRDGMGCNSLLSDTLDICRLNEVDGPVSSFTRSSDSVEIQNQTCDSRAVQGVGLKPSGVTVNKVQQWMQQGRVLSSQMEQRISGSPPNPSAPHPPCSYSRPSSEAEVVAQTSRVQKHTVAAACQESVQSVLIKNVDSLVTNTEDTVGSKCNETLRRIATVTVSKKRHWLQQSNDKCSGFVEGAISIRSDAHHSGPKPEGSLASSVMSFADGRDARSQLCDVIAARSRTVGTDGVRPMNDIEENDADDEGEIWYNPIPEEEDPTPYGDLNGTRLVQQSEVQSDQNGHGCKATSRNIMQSTDTAEHHRWFLSRQSADENHTPRAADGTEAGLFTPSSPKPWKKGGPISWSFPDKIKSPRTMRKLSMKMKKLPELSRKLSVKTTASSCSQQEPQQSSVKTAHAADPGLGLPCLSPSQSAASSNVISRYHLDSSVSTQHSYGQRTTVGSKSASKGGYLSDGDSPELVTKSGKRRLDWKAGRSKETSVGPKLHGTEMDVDSFRHYSFVEQAKCSQYISGLMSLHFFGAEDLKPPRVDSRSVYCAIQVDSVNKARTALLTCKTAFLDMDHTFNIELENAQQLKLVVFSWESTPRRHRVCCHGTVALPALFRVTRSHQLAVRLEPRGLIYVKLVLMERWQNTLRSPDGGHDPQVFGVDASRVVEREGAGLTLPLLVKKCISEIERRGCQAVGLYRLCGSAAVKKDLREAFERDSHSVLLAEEFYPDVNVITGILKDYLRELPAPLISEQLYMAVLESMARRPLRIGSKGCENDPADSEYVVGLLDHLPQVEKTTLQTLLNHLKLVASHHEVNKMTCQNLAVCFGPVLLGQRQEASYKANRVFADSEEMASALQFKQHIEVLHYLLQLWPVVDRSQASSLVNNTQVEVPQASPCLRRRRQRPQALNICKDEIAGVLRPRPGRMDSPSNRYAGDWSLCREDYLQPPKKSTQGEADYDIVPWEDEDAVEMAEAKAGEEEKVDDMEMEVEERVALPENSKSHILLTQNGLSKEAMFQGYLKIQDMSPVLSNRLNLNELQQSIDKLIGSLERELNKNSVGVGY